MLDKYKFTDKEQKEILKSMAILVDTREQNNSHILNWFESKNIKYKSKKLDYGDYSFYIPRNEEFSIHRDIYYSKNICIERKSSTDELVGNFASDRIRIENEFLRHKGRMYLLIEDEKFYSNIHSGNYKSKYNSKAALGTYHSFIDKYHIYPMFTIKELSGSFIYRTFYYYLRNLLK